MERLDLYLSKDPFFSSRTLAQDYIKEGLVKVNGKIINKASYKVEDKDVVTWDKREIDFVSRGGNKFYGAILDFNINLNGKVVLDVGASTGGFTDCMLQNGAVKVYSVDVGHGQLAWKLRNDERVVCLEKTNVRYITEEQVPDSIDFSSIDVSFISLTKVLMPVRNLLAPHGQVVCLIKPQFEAGREKVGKKGVVREKSVHHEVIEMVIDYALANGFKVLNLDFSPIKGPEGNIEYLLHIEKTDHFADSLDFVDKKIIIGNIVEKAHEQLN